MEWGKIIADESSGSELHDRVLEAEEILVSVGDSGYDEVENPSTEWCEMASNQASEILLREGSFLKYDEDVFYFETSEGDEYSIKCYI